MRVYELNVILSSHWFHLHQLYSKSVTVHFMVCYINKENKNCRNFICSILLHSFGYIHLETPNFPERETVREREKNDTHCIFTLLEEYRFYFICPLVFFGLMLINFYFICEYIKVMHSLKVCLFNFIVHTFLKAFCLFCGGYWFVFHL